MCFSFMVPYSLLFAQRCSSYLRLIAVRAAAAGQQQRAKRLQQQHYNGPTTASNSSGEDAAGVDTESPEAAIRSHSQLLEASLELGGVYSALEHAKLHGGVAKAICIDEIVDEGAVGAGLDILSPLSLDAQQAADERDGDPVDALADTEVRVAFRIPPIPRKVPFRCVAGRARCWRRGHRVHCHRGRLLCLHPRRATRICNGKCRRRGKIDLSSFYCCVRLALSAHRFLRLVL